MPAFFLVALIIVLLPAASASAQSPVIDSARVQTAVKQSWTQAPPEWQTRLTQDETMAACSQYRNNPPRAVAEAIVAREKASIKYPADGKLMGDWKKGQKLAQS
jgi:sulfur-oxidizing protein SoxX